DGIRDFHVTGVQTCALPIWIFADWKQSVHRQAKVLGKFIAAHKGDPPLTILDCACGIGTQAIGLALAGYSVYGTDLSPEAIEREIGRASCREGGQDYVAVAV